MHEILFRGKTADNGEWVYGYYVFQKRRIGGFGQTVTANDSDRHYIVTSRGEAFEVIPETVEQYTGLTTFGTKIFEGDIVKITYYSIPDYKETEIRAVTYDESECCYYPMRWKDYCEICDSYTNIDEIEVIGNIHDNSELLN